MQATHGELGALRVTGRGESELSRLVALALPLAAANLGQMLLSVVSTAVTGRLGPVELGAVGLGSTLFFTVLVLGMGVMLAIDPLAARAFGDGDRPRAARALWQGIGLALGLWIPLAALLLALGAWLERAGVDAASSRATRSYLVAAAPGLLPYLWFVAMRSYLAADGRAKPVLAAVVVGNLVHLPLSLLLVLGAPSFGFAGCGVSGAGWALTLAMMVELAVLVVAAHRSTDRDARAPRFDRSLAAQTLRLGIPAGFAMLAEFGVFSLVNLLVGRFDARALAAHQVAITLAGTSFMIPVGIGAAAAVRVGNAVGRQDFDGARRAGITSLWAGAAFTLAAAGAFLLAPRTLCAFLTDDADVIARATPLLAIAAGFQLADGLQAVAAGALRGAGDTRAPLRANLVGHYLVGLPIGALLGFGFGLGTRGLWVGLFAGLTVVALLLVSRFTTLSARNLARPGSDCVSS